LNKSVILREYVEEHSAKEIERIKDTLEKGGVEETKRLSQFKKGRLIFPQPLLK
jgi:hypothetical protein